VCSNNAHANLMMLAPSTVLRGLKDLADLAVAAGFDFSLSARHGINSVRLPRCDRANKSIGQGYIQRRTIDVAKLKRYLAGTFTQTQDAGEAAYSAQCGLVAMHSRRRDAAQIEPSLSKRPDLMVSSLLKRHYGRCPKM